MQKRSVNGALKVFTNNMSGGILPLTEETLQLLESKHPEAKVATQQAILVDNKAKRQKDVRVRIRG